MDDQDRKNWLATLKPGDKVAIPSKSLSRYSYYRLETIKRLTPTQIIMETGKRYRKDNGNPVGEQYGAYIAPYSDEVKENMRLVKLVQEVEDALEGVDKMIRMGVGVSRLHTLKELLESLNLFLRNGQLDTQASA